MIEFVLGNRRLRLHPDGIMYARSHMNGVETKNETWKPIRFTKGSRGYKCCNLTIDEIPISLLEHRIVYYAHNQDWDIWDSSMDNYIDHYNQKKDDNRIENLHVVTHQENMWNTNAKGYYWNETKQKWCAQITRDGIVKSIGSFDTEEDARNAYLEAKAKLHI